MLEPRQALLPVVNGLALLADRGGGFHAAGSFLHGRHVFSAQGFIAHQATPGCFKDGLFHLNRHTVEKRPGGKGRELDQCAPRSDR